MEKETSRSQYYSEVNLRPSSIVILIRPIVWHALSYQAQHELARMIDEIGARTARRAVEQEHHSLDVFRQAGVAFAHITDANYQRFSEAAEPVWRLWASRPVESWLLAETRALLDTFRSFGHSAPGGRSGVEIEKTHVYFATDRQDEQRDDLRYRFGSGRGGLVYGTVELLYPSERSVGSVVGDIVLAELEITDDSAQFIDEIASHADALIYVHGYNTTFENALQTAVHIADDLEFKGAIVVYSWPSDGVARQYVHDMTASDYTRDHFSEFLLDFSLHGHHIAPNLIVHSMGARVVVRSLESMVAGFGRDTDWISFKNLIFAAPDEDTAVFARASQTMGSFSERITVYASSEDAALKTARLLHGYPRAGEAGDKLLDLDGIDAIDASVTDTGFLGHSYISKSRVLTDVHQIIKFGAAPDDRALLRRVEPSQAVKRRFPYWTFKPTD